MGLLIPGPSCPGKDLDVFLEPLIEELQQLWKGVSTFDALSGKDFDLHAIVIWCIHDYPALSTLLGRVTKGYYACVHCDKNPCSRRIKKIRYAILAIDVSFHGTIYGGQINGLMVRRTILKNQRNLVQTS
jgi:hypothetical protein